MITQQLFSFFIGLCIGLLSVMSSLSLTRTIFFSALATGSKNRGTMYVIQTVLLKTALVSLAVWSYVERKGLSAAFIGAGVVLALCSLAFIKKPVCQ